MNHPLPADSPDLEAHLTALLDKLTTQQKVRLLSGDSAWSLPAEPAIGLRSIVMSDGPSGVRGVSMDDRDPSASLPSATAVASTWDLDLVDRLGALIAAEARAKNVDIVLGPTVNLHRTPRGGRHFEAFSEDPWLSGRIGAAYVAAVQAHGVGATAKHYVANDSETERLTVDARVDERTLREVYLAPFERMVVEGGAWLVMSSYNQVNGVTMSANPLLREPLKDEWCFDGAVVSDWTAVRDTVESAASGQDLVMPGPDTPWGDALVEAIRAGKVDQAAVDDKALRLLRLAARVGALDSVAPVTTPPAPWQREDIRSLLRQVAVDAMVLVRNDGVLPIAADTAPRLAVIGHHARRGRNQGGGSAMVFPETVVSPLEGLRDRYGADHVTYAPGLVPSAELVPFARGSVTDPVTGGPGIRVRYLDPQGTPFAEEVFPSGRFGWLGDERLARTATLQITAHYTPDCTGRHRLGFAGIGRHTFRVDGRVLSTGPVAADSDDVLQAILNPPSRAVDIELEAGRPVEITLEFQPDLPGGFPLARLALGTEDVFGTPAEELALAEALAAAADIAIVVVGTTETIESEGLDRPTLALPEGQDELVRRVLAANPRTVVVVNSGGPVLMPWLGAVPATLLAWFPGQEFGAALADVLSGDREPGGRIPTTWPAAEADVPVWQVEPVDGRLEYTEGIHVGYREWLRRSATGGPAPAIPFGHGLGYTTWEIANPAVETASDGSVTLTVDVTNTGSRSGKHVVQAYLSRATPSAIDRPACWLAGYAPVHAEPGATVTARLEIEPRSFEHWSIDEHAWIREPGAFSIRVGAGVAELGAAVDIPAPRD
ncbi:beta-glucosidase family protein [Nocardia tengchongensis]|uniref:beta-glucosidase family protein n=1 Tax=Nocardia tengchongensis TaxID=2055889 RepID=UPI0036BC5977